MSLDHLFSPLAIRTLEIPNRIVMPPMATNYGTTDGFVTESQIAYYVERAKGGVGYITTEHVCISQQGKASANVLLIITDKHRASIQKLVEAVHQAGAKIVVQINHAGRQSNTAVTGSPLVAPSPIACPTREEIPHELSQGEIQEIVEAFSMAAKRVQEAGADGVELHMAHGYLLCSFLSPFANKRTDHYGGDIPGRARFPLEVVKSVRESVGPHFPIICRLSAEEYVEDGLTIAESRQIAKMLETEGADALHVSATNHASVHLMHPTYYSEEGIFVPLAQAIKSDVNIPVIAVGRIMDPAMADDIIRQGKADLVSMGRALLADPHLPRKAQEGRFEEIIPCISCTKCIQAYRKGSVRCTVNPETGNESRFKFQKTDRPKQVWVIGGGPGGLKAAEIAAMRGHEVTLFEKQPQLGGRMRLAAVPPRKAVINNFLDYLERRIRGLGINVELGKEFTVDMLSPDGPQAVIVANGARPISLDLKGADDKSTLSVDAVLSGSKEVGEKVLVVGGGGIGAETADYLSEAGKEVTLVEMLEEIASDLVVHLKHNLKRRLKEKGVTILTSTKVNEIEAGYALVETSSGVEKIGEFDSIVLALGYAPDDELAKSIEGKVPEVYVIGDASQPREAMEALYEGEEVAIKI